MRWHCPTCDVTWWPYQTERGSCCQCGGGTRQTYSPASPDAVPLHKAALKQREAREESERLRSEFEDFYAEREARINGLDRLPVAEPDRERAA